MGTLGSPGHGRPRSLYPSGGCLTRPTYKHAGTLLGIKLHSEGLSDCLLSVCPLGRLFTLAYIQLGYTIEFLDINHALTTPYLDSNLLTHEVWTSLVSQRADRLPWGMP